jgi:hypothetical protein
MIQQHPTTQLHPEVDRFKFVVPHDTYVDTKEGDDSLHASGKKERHSERGEPKRRALQVHEVRLAMKGEYPA